MFIKQKNNTKFHIGQKLMTRLGTRAVNIHSKKFIHILFLHIQSKNVYRNANDEEEEEI